jgi:hypothetical protein
MDAETPTRTDEGETATYDSVLREVLRCEQVREEQFSFGIALHSREPRYLPKEEAAKFGAMLEEISATAKK